MAYKSNGFDPFPLLFGLSFIYLGCQGSVFLGDDVKCENASSIVAACYFLKDKNRLNLQTFPGEKKGKEQKDLLSFINTMCLFTPSLQKTLEKLNNSLSHQ